LFPGVFNRGKVDRLPLRKRGTSASGKQLFGSSVSRNPIPDWKLAIVSPQRSHDF
jgi:hypothetical protein